MEEVGFGFDLMGAVKELIDLKCGEGELELTWLRLILFQYLMSLEE